MKRTYLLILLCSMGMAAFGSTHYYYFPSAQNSFTGAATVCTSASTGSATLTYNFSTCKIAGPSQNTATNVNIYWYQNSSNSTTGGAMVYSVTGTTGTSTNSGSFTYAPNQAVGTNYYYYVVVTWTPAQSGCGLVGTVTSTSTQEITVNASPAAIGNFPSAAICPNSPVILTDATTGGTWNSGTTGVATVTDIDATSATLNGVGAGTSVITYSAAGCSATATATVIPGPAAVTVSPTVATSVCGGGSGVALTASGGNVAATGSVTTSSGSISVAIPDATASGGISGIAVSNVPTGVTITGVSVNINVTHSYDGDLTLCLTAPNGSTIDLYNAGNSSNDDPDVGAKFTNTTISSAGGTAFNYSSTTQAPYTGTYAAALNGTASDGPTSLPVNATSWASLYSIPNGTWQFSGVDHYSIDAGVINSWSVTISYSLSATSSYTWSPPTGLTCTSCSNPIANPSSTTVYTATTTYSVNGCSVSATTGAISLGATPTANISPSVTTATCTSQQLQAITDIGNTYQWYNGIGIINGATNATYMATVTGTYYVNIGQNTSSCNANSPNVIINVTPVTASISPANPIACGTQTLTAVTNSGDTYQWYNSSGEIGGANSSTLALSNVGATQVSNTYSVQVTNSSLGCSTTSPSTTVTLNPIPTSAITTPGNITSQCGGSIVMMANTNIGDSYQWSNSSGNITGATSATYAATVSNTYAVNIKNSGTSCGTNSTSTAITINAIPSASVTPSTPVIICGSQLLTGGTNTGNMYQWYNSLGLISGATNNTYTAVNTGSLTVTSAYSVQVTNSATTCNSTSAGTSVTLNALPAANITTPGGLTANCSPITMTGNTDIGDTYQWSNSSGAISGATTASYTATVTGTYTINISKNSTGCNTNSSSIAINITPVPSASVTPTGPVTVCGSQLLTAGSDFGTSFQWYNSSGPISGATNITYTASNTSPVTTTDIYSVQATIGSCGSTSAGTTVTLNPLPTAGITTPGNITSICGTSIVMTGNTNFGDTYQWSNGSGVITGATNISYTATVTGTYYVNIAKSGAGCNANSANTAITINAIPSASITPSGTVTVCGSQLLTAVTNIGNAYQWYNGTSLINGATNSTYTAMNTGSVQLTNVYSVQVTNSLTTCNLASAGTTVKLNPIPTSSVSPTGTVTACGSQVLTAGSNIGNRYQWYNGGGIINGATDNTYTANNTGSTATTDVYSVTVTSSTTGCNSTSPATTVILNAIPTSSVSPPGTVTACGSELLTAGTNIGNAYQWYSSTSGVIGGATNSTYTVNNTGSVSVTAIYSVMVTNGGTGCNLTSAGTTVIVNPIPTASVTPAGPVTACGHQLLTAVTDIGNKYQWYNGSGIINGATNNTYTAGNTGSVTTTDVYSVMVTSSTTGCNSTSPATTVILNAIPTSTVTTAGGVMTNCGSLALTGASNIGDAYQWYNSGGAINGATTTSYTATVSSSYYMRATNTATGCDSNSVALAITINPYPVVTVTTNGPTTFCAGSGITLTANNGYNYQWQNYGVNIGGATNHTYTSSGSGIFRVILSTNAPCIDTTTTTTVTVNPMPSEVITAEGPVAFCTGSSVTLSAQTGLVNYQWVDPVNGIGGANGNSYTATASGSYRVALTGTGNCRDTSIVLVVTALPLPANGVNVSGATTFCAGGSVTLTAPAGLSYQWEDGVTAIAGAVGQSYTTGVSGNYKVLLSDGQCSDSSLVTGVTNASPDTSLTVTGSYRVASGELTFCSGGSLTFSGTAGAGSYRWDSGTAAIPGANGPSYIVTGTGLYTLIMGSSFGCTDSVWRKIEVDTLPDPVIYAYGYGLQTTGVYVSYQWYLNGAAIPGATNRDYLATTQGPYTVLVTDANGCSGMSASTTLNNLNVGAVTGIDISLYPNPSSSVVYIESPVKVNAVVYTIEGQEVIRKADAKDVDLSRLANGTYMIKLTGEDGTLLKIGKLVKSE